MFIRMNQRGEGKLGCVMGLLLLAAACFIAYKLIPVKVKAAEMRDAVEDAALSAGQNSQEGLRQQLIYKANQLELPITEDNIKIERRSQYVSITVTYTVPVEFPGFTYNWKFSPHKENPVF